MPGIHSTQYGATAPSDVAILHVDQARRQCRRAHAPRERPAPWTLRPCPRQLHRCCGSARESQHLPVSNHRISRSGHSRAALKTARACLRNSRVLILAGCYLLEDRMGQRSPPLPPRGRRFRWECVCQQKRTLRGASGKARRIFPDRAPGEGDAWATAALHHIERAMPPDGDAVVQDAPRDWPVPQCAALPMPLRPAARARIHRTSHPKIFRFDARRTPLPRAPQKSARW